MNLTTQIKPATLNTIELMRKSRLDSLIEFQDIFVEFMVRDADCFTISKNNDTIGYAITTDDNTLIEFFILENHNELYEDVFADTINQLNTQLVLCQTFDLQLMNCCLGKQLIYEVIGLLYRNYTDKQKFTAHDIVIDYATANDLPFLSSQNDEVFEPKQLLASFIKNKEIIMFRKNDDVIGCGFITRIHNAYNYLDLGIWVAPQHRKKGYATKLITYLKEVCLKNEFIPTVGCSIDNIASQKTLSKAGFVSNYKLLEFKV